MPVRQNHCHFIRFRNFRWAKNWLETYFCGFPAKLPKICVFFTYGLDDNVAVLRLFLNLSKFMIEFEDFRFELLRVVFFESVNCCLEFPVANWRLPSAIRISRTASAGLLFCPWDRAGTQASVSVAGYSRIVSILNQTFKNKSQEIILNPKVQVLKPTHMVHSRILLGLALKC